MTGSASARESGRVIASFGRHYAVEPAASPGLLLQAHPRGKRSELCVGDTVELTRLGSDQAAIESVLPRRNLLYRSDRARRKLLAANIDQAAVVLSADPPFSEELLLRVLTAASVAQIPVLLIINKADLSVPQSLLARLQVYEALGYPRVWVSARQAPEETCNALTPLLGDRTTLLLGQSGMGKSTLVNCLAPGADLQTQAISQALSSGRHTTTFSRMFEASALGAVNARIIDSPGFQLFGIAHLSSSQLMHALPDMAEHLGACRFANCLHRQEPGCAVSTAVAAGQFDARRHELYQAVLAETLADGVRDSSSV